MEHERFLAIPIPNQLQQFSGNQTTALTNGVVHLGENCCKMSECHLASPLWKGAYGHS